MSLTKFTGNNSGGIVKMWYIPHILFIRGGYDVATGLHTLGCDYMLLNEIYFQPDSCELEIEEKTTNNINISITAKLPKIRPDMVKAARELTFTPFVLLLLDSNANYLLVGNQIEFLLTQATAKNGADIADFNHVQFNVDRDLMFYPVFIKNPFPEIVVTPPETPTIPDPPPVIPSDDLTWSQIIFNIIGSVVGAKEYLKSASYNNGLMEMVFGNIALRGGYDPLVTFKTPSIVTSSSYQVSFDVYMDAYVKNDNIFQLAVWGVFKEALQGGGYEYIQILSNWTSNIAPYADWRTYNVTVTNNNANAVLDEMMFVFAGHYTPDNQYRTVENSVLKIRNVIFTKI